MDKWNTPGETYFYATDSGSCFPTFADDEWDGQAGCVTNDRIGILLDLDATGVGKVWVDGKEWVDKEWKGSMTVYKNDKLLGVMATGLVGSFCCKSHWCTTSSQLHTWPNTCHLHACAD